MAALSPAHDNTVSLCLVIFLTVLLALSLAAVIASPPQTDGPPAEGADAEPDLPKPAPEPPAFPLPRRVAGQSGVAYPAGDPAHPPGVTRPSRASGAPPWGPAPKPPGGGRHRRRAARRRPDPGVPVPVHYGGQVIDTRTGRTWRCSHNHPTEESATRCADAMEERIKRLGWDKATGERL
jgi:hypothetical protein